MADAKEVFLEALGLPDGERRSFVATVCRDQPEVERLVLELLDYHGQSGDLLDVPSLDDLLGAIGGAVPDRLGEYRVEGLLGVGAMGVVYRARRDATNEVVALKVLRSLAWSKDAVSRLRREADALIRLDHPGIARLLAGPSPSSPWSSSTVSPCASGGPANRRATTSCAWCGPSLGPSSMRTHRALSIVT